MNKNWLSVIIAAVFEVCWVIGLNHADQALEWVGTCIAIFVSFYLMIKASRTLSVGTVYAVFVGLGTAGTVVAEIIFFDAPVKIMKIILILFLLAGVVSLKLLSNEKETEVH